MQEDNNLDLGVFYDELNFFLTICHDHEYLFRQNHAMQKSKNHANKEYFSEKLAVHSELLCERYEKLISLINKAESSFNEMTNFHELKELLAYEFNNVYHQAGRLEDFVDGFNIKFEPYKNEYSKLVSEFSKYEASDAVLGLHETFLKYLIYYDVSHTIGSCKQIATAVYESFNNFDYKRREFRLSPNSGVIKIELNKIKKLKKLSEAKFGEIQKQLNLENKKYSEKEIEENQELVRKFAIIKDKMDSLNEVISQADKFLIRSMAQRKSAYKKNLRIHMSVVDMLYGGGYFTKKWSPKWVYATKPELEQIKFLLENIDEKSDIYSEVFSDDDIKKNEQNYFVSSPFPEFD